MARNLNTWLTEKWIEAQFGDERTRAYMRHVHRAIAHADQPYWQHQVIAKEGERRAAVVLALCCLWADTVHKESGTIRQLAPKKRRATVEAYLVFYFNHGGRREKDRETGIERTVEYPPLLQALTDDQRWRLKQEVLRIAGKLSNALEAMGLIDVGEDGML